ncbi:hypothetical protein MOUN0_E02850 [Monosporozyma unispora]|nr:hypothetical protein C6P44_003687 [Kazachstania unispora]
MSTYPFQLLQDNYKLAGMAKDKLNRCISPRSSHSKRTEYNLREVVGHANLLDNVLTNIDKIKFNYLKEQEYKLHQRSNEFYRNSSYGNDLIQRSGSHLKNSQLYYNDYDDEEDNIGNDSFDIDDRLENDDDDTTTQHGISDEGEEEEEDNEDLFTLSNSHPIPIANSGPISRRGGYNSNCNYNYIVNAYDDDPTYMNNNTLNKTPSTSPQDISTMYYRNHI